MLSLRRGTLLEQTACVLATIRAQTREQSLAREKGDGGQGEVTVPRLKCVVCVEQESGSNAVQVTQLPHYSHQNRSSYLQALLNVDARDTVHPETAGDYS